MTTTCMLHATFAVFLALTLAFAGCGDDEDGGSEGQASNSTSNETSEASNATSNDTSASNSTATSNDTGSSGGTSNGTGSSNGTNNGTGSSGGTNNGTGTSNSTGSSGGTNNGTGSSNGTSNGTGSSNGTSNGTGSSNGTSNGTSGGATCEGEPPSPCGMCGSDAGVMALCEDGQWVCPEGTEFVGECPDQTCDMFGGEVCCDAEGNATSALCPSASQPYCPDGSEPQQSCEEDPLPEFACRTHEDCNNFASCTAPGESIGCGICQDQPNCTMDEECGAGNICDPSTIEDCTCSGGSICKLGCRGDDDCDAGQVCGDDLRCRPQRCEDQDGCPEQFSCVEGACARRACERDTICDDEGRCVLGSCYDSFGFCSQPPP
ncbi:MAG: hypothetical protein AAFS10_17345 [Myxococcota bacterium]